MLLLNGVLVTGIEHQADVEEVRATVHEDIVPDQSVDSGLGTEMIQQIEALEMKLDQIIEGNYQ